jgi:hypothetical protein
MCQKNILESSGGRRIISVSHKPIDFGENIVMELERGNLAINIQMMEALKRVNTKYIAIAEHDCLYTSEHYNFIPPDDSFWYNENVWCLQTHSDNKPEYNGMFSWFRERKANSQVVVSTEQMIKATQDKIDIMSDPSWKARYPTGRIGEAGAMDYDHAMRLAVGKSLEPMREVLKKYISDYIGKNFNTELPNVDIRHRNNYTKNRRGTKRCYEIPHWGTMADIFKDQ